MPTAQAVPSFAPWRWFARVRPRGRRPTWQRVRPDDLAPRDEAAADDVPRGCAWYVSSDDLARGAEVHEGAWDGAEASLAVVHELYWPDAVGARAACTSPS